MLNLTKDDDGKLFINGAQAVSSDVVATNGVMYVIDEVLVPDEGIYLLYICSWFYLTALILYLFLYFGDFKFRFGQILKENVQATGLVRMCKPIWII